MEQRTRDKGYAGIAPVDHRTDGQKPEVFGIEILGLGLVEALAQNLKVHVCPFRPLGEFRGDRGAAVQAAKLPSYLRVRGGDGRRDSRGIR